MPPLGSLLYSYGAIILIYIYGVHSLFLDVVVLGCLCRSLGLCVMFLYYICFSPSACIYVRSNCESDSDNNVI